MAVYSTVGSLESWMKNLSWPEDFVTAENLPDFLGKIYVLDHSLEETPAGTVARVSVAIDGEAELEIPGLDSVSLVAGGGDGYTVITGQVRIEENWQLSLLDVDLALRFDPDVLKPATLDGSEPEDEYVEVSTTGAIHLTSTFDVEIEGFDSFDLSPAEIGDSGVILAAEDVMLDLSRTSSPQEIKDAGFDRSFVGIYVGEADIVLPESLPIPEDLKLQNCAIGSGGVSGEVSVTNDDLGFDEDTQEFTGDGAGELGGFAFGLREVDLEFKQNALISSKIEGELFLPYFEKRVSAEVGFDLDGSLSVRVTGPTQFGNTNDSVNPDSGLLTLDTDAFEMAVESIELTVGDPSMLAVAGTVTPTIDAFDVPGLEVEELAVDSNGDIHFEGGWVDLPDQYSVDLYGVTLELTKLGFGKTDAGEKWIGLNGGVRIVEGVPAGASVEGLRIFWDDDGFQGIELNGIGVEFEVPGTLRFKGEVSMVDDEFRGDIKLDLIALNCSIDAELVVGETTQDGQTFSYFGIYLDADLPAGIPLFSTGTGIYGFSGLFAHQMEPAKGDRKWYDLSGEGDKSWFHYEDDGATDLEKWEPKAGSLGLGAGVTIATLPDNGFTVAGDLLLVLVLPGPIIMLQGGADILSSGTNSSEEAAFQALAVLDNREGSFTLGMDVSYKKGGDDGALIDIHAGTEAFFSFHDPTAWHLYLGRKEPPEDRIRAEALYLFTADAYFMLDPDKLALGAKVGYDANWSFGPVGVVFEAWIAANAMVNWNPLHFFGELLVHGKVALKVFGFSLGMSIDARVAADVYDPFHLIGEFSVALDLPWPLPDPSVDVTLEWGPEKEVPPVPRPLGDVAVGHQKVTTRWPLSRKPTEDGEYPALVRPDYGDGDLLKGSLDASRPDPSAEPPDTLPVVPPDGRPQLNFAKPVHDDGKVGINHQEVKPSKEVIGDPAKNEGPIEVSYKLKAVRLAKRTGSTWTDIEDVFGSWAPLPKSQAGTGGATRPNGAPALSNTKLQLHSKNPFDYGRHTHGSWEEGTQRLLDDYPCTVDVGCFDFDELTIDDFTETEVADSGTTWYELTRDGHDDWPTFAVQAGQKRLLPSIVSTPRPEWPRALFYPEYKVISGPSHDQDARVLTTRLEITPATPYKSVRVRFTSSKHETCGTVRAYDEDGVVDERTLSLGGQLTTADGSGLVEMTFTSDDSAVESVVVEAKGPIAIVEFCQADADFEQIGPQETSGINHTREQLVRWADEDRILEPNTVYRLAVDTVVEAEGKSGGELADFSRQWYDENDSLTEHVFFRTGGPPGIDPEPSVPTTVEEPEKFSSGLENLARYVRQTIPETVPAEGEQPLEPRPVYRAYDVGVEFSEDYVETLYRMARRDLGLYLFDTNDRPIRDVFGRLVATDNQWGKTDSQFFDDHERAWLQRVKASGCMDVDKDTSPLDDALSADEGVVLGASTTYEARLSPLLVRDAFDDGLGHWTEDGDSGPDWSTPGHGVIEGTDAQLSGATVTLDGNPSLGDVVADADSIHFPGDTNSEEGNYHITSVDAGANEVTLDGEPDLSDDNQADDRRWRIAPRHSLRQSASVADGATDAPETTLELTSHPRLDGAIQSPEEWTDFRVSTTLRADQVDSGAIGLAFRRDGSGDHYRFELDANADAWKLVCATNGDEEVLASHDKSFEIRRDFELPGGLGGIGGGGGIGGAIPLVLPWNGLEEGRDYHVAIEALGSDIRVYVDGEPVFEIEDDTLSAGTVGVYCRAVDEAHVPEVRVDDYRSGEPAAPVPYRFKFTTSKYANFFHHAHSYQDETWQQATDVSPNGANPAASLDAAVATDLAYADIGSLSSPTQTEVRSFDAALSALASNDSLGQLRKRPDRTTVTRFDNDGSPLAYLLASPEPIDWVRTDLSASSVDRNSPTVTVPGTAKLTDADLGSDEAVTLLYREETDPTDWAIDYRRSDAEGFDPTLAEDRFVEPFEGSITDRYDVVVRDQDGIDVSDFELADPIPIPGFSAMDAEGDESDVDGEGDNGADDNDEGDGIDIETQFFADFASGGGSVPSPTDFSGGTLLSGLGDDDGWRVEDDTLVGDRSGASDLVVRAKTWSDGVWTATVEASDPGEVGLLFRYDSVDDHYRLSISADRGLRLVRRHGGMTDVLWQGEMAVQPDRAYGLTVEASGGRLRGLLDGITAFVVDDLGGSGSVGVHADAAGEVRVTDLGVYEASYESDLFADEFDGNLDDWEFVDQPPYSTQESDWHVAGGQLRQTSNIYGHVGNEYHEPGTYGVTGDPEWRDYRASVRLHSGDNDAIGVIVRYQDDDNYYRFSMDCERKYRRLTKRVDGTTTVLWEDDEQFDSDHEYAVTLECVGSELTGYLDGEALFSVTDDALAAGQIGVYCRANVDARFAGIRVTAPADGWTPYYEFDGEDTLPAGTRVRINRTGPAPTSAGQVQRDLAPDGDAPSKLPPTGVDLRVRQPDVPIHAETADHARRFLPDDDYSDLSTKVLRNADGTGVLVVPTENLGANPVRFDLTYRRDAGERTLRQAGSSDPENAVLDVPWTAHSGSE